MHTMDGTARDWPGQGATSSITYDRTRRLLGAALSRLAATGYPVPPDEAMDLIHDFCVEAWGDLIARFDPSRAQLETYVFACFLRFARPRIARLARLRSTLVTPAEMEAMLGAGTDTATVGTDGSDIAATRRAIAALPDGVRRLLTSYTDDARPSERDLAARFDMTRYQLRTQLADALGHVAIQLGAIDSFAEPDRAIAIALWADNRSSRETAGLLGIPITDVQAARRRMFARLVHAVKGAKHMTNSDPFKGDATPSIQALVASALSSGATDDDLAAVRDRRDAVWRYFETREENEARALYEAADPLRLAALYAALGEDLSAPGTQPSEALAAFLEARDDDERSIGRAFTQTLIVNLPRYLTQFGQFFAEAPTLEPAIYEVVSRDPSVLAAGASAVELAWFGITPVTIAESARALSNLADLIAREMGGHLMLIGADTTTGSSGAVITRTMAVDELGMSFDLPKETIALLFDWIVAVAGRKPLLFDGFVTELRGDDLELRRTDAAEPNLFRRWRSDVSTESGPAVSQHQTTAAA